MKPRITIVTLGVADLGRATRFYGDGLGLPRHPFEGDAIAFFQLHAGQLLALFPIDELAADAKQERVAPADSFRGVTLAHNVDSREEVESTLEEARRAGGTIVKAGEAPPWGGWSGYFADPDGHLWEVAWQPALSF